MSARERFEAFKASQSTKLYGCMLIFWNTQTESVQPVILNSDGGLNGRTKDSDSLPLSLSIPGNAKQQTFLFRMYLLQPHEGQEPDPNETFDTHRSVCQKMIFFDYDCFSPENITTCWLAFSFAPKTTSTNVNIFDKIVDTDGNKVSCRICSPEVCGDGKDNNCNGEKDEYEEENGRQACPVQEGSSQPTDGGPDQP
ncbi:MAG: hypothetical protein H6728_08250 [Myxococcales bacterium]|nr:hypothetical protein [Myxococcales bacterium]